MGKVTAIEWTADLETGEPGATFNPWTGCERVSPACAHCYAATAAKRWGEDLWATGEFAFRAESYWRKPHSWNRDAMEARRPKFVFCASMADVFQIDDRLVGHRERLWQVIAETPWLVWLLLTKRPENIERMLPWDEAPDNVWLGTSVENSRFTWRARALAEVPAPVHFLSCEPLLGSLFESRGNREPLDLTDIEWVIGGGESGPRFRPFRIEHVRELRDRTAAAGVPFFWKQNGGLSPKAGGKEIDGRQWCERPMPMAPLELALF